MACLFSSNHIRALCIDRGLGGVDGSTSFTSSCILSEGANGGFCECAGEGGLAFLLHPCIGSFGRHHRI